ncbi:MAG: FadR/GntR family transcriptional regulator [Akkermansiaceae bacterium]
MNRPTRGADKIISAISSQLANETLKGGDRLPSEAKLCEEFNVSRTVVREAIQQLKAIGVVNTITGSGSYVTEGDLLGLKSSLEFYAIMTGDTKSWIELLELRVLLESSCARKLAGEGFSEAGLQKLKAALQAQADNQSDTKLFSALDVRFHQVLTMASGNRIILAVLSSLENLQQKFSKETYLAENTQLLIDRNLQEHSRIVEAIEKRDPDLAEEAMQNHLNETKKYLLQYIERRARDLDTTLK